LLSAVKRISSATWTYPNETALDLPENWVNARKPEVSPTNVWIYN
jgi:hypothetical protein